MYPETAFCTPSSCWRTASTHQKHPAPKVATSAPSRTSFFELASADIFLDPVICSVLSDPLPQLATSKGSPAKIQRTFELKNFLISMKRLRLTTLFTIIFSTILFTINRRGSVNRPAVDHGLEETIFDVLGGIHGPGALAIVGDLSSNLGVHEVSARD